MDEGELTPLRKQAAGSYVMMNAQLETFEPTGELRISTLSARDLARPISSMAQAARAMAIIASYGGETNKDAMKAAACISMIAGGVEAMAALKELTDMWKSAKIAQGVASILQKANPIAIAAVAALAIGGAAAYAATMSSREFRFEGDLSTHSGIRELNASLAREGFIWR